MKSPTPLVSLVFALATLIAVAPVVADWPHPRGPETSGGQPALPALATDTFGLDGGWRVTLGSGYSGIAVSGHRVVTQFSAGDGNWASAHDAASGDELWRHRTGPILKGLDGSDDGPLSSPVIGHGLAFVLDPRGRLAALKLADGSVTWEVHLADDLGAVAPHFGFTTTPVLANDILIITGGGDGHAATGLRATTGEVVWRAGDGGVDYQSPTLMTLGGQMQVVTVTSAGLTGLDPANGDLLWHHAFAEGDRANSAVPTALGDDDLLIPIGGGVAAYRVTRDGDAWQVEERYRSNVLGRSYAMPVYHEGHVYGFRGQILNCMNAETGERVWRSRPPGGGGLIRVGNRLVIFAAKGNVVVADASPEGYHERARYAPLDGSSLTWPSLAGGRVFVRNLEELAAVEITRDAGATAVADAATADHDFGRWLAKAQASEDPQAMVDAMWAEHPELPIVEGGHVHFLYRGDATEVVMGGSMLDADATVALSRLAGTDLFYTTQALTPGARWEYRFQADFGDWVTDPRNPRTVPAVNGPSMFSEVATPGYPAMTHLGEPKGDRGTVERFTLKSKALDAEKEIAVYLPPGYGDSKERYPLLVVSDGTAWLEKGDLPRSLDNLTAAGTVRPTIVAFVPPAGAWWEEAGGSKTEPYAQMQAEELVPALGERYRIARDPGARAVLGHRFYGLAAAWTALRHHDVFGQVAIFSPSLLQGYGGDLTEKIAKGVGRDVHVYLDWNRFDYQRVDRGYDFGAESRALAAELEAGGYAMAGGEMLDSFGWGAWRNRTAAMLQTLFPATE